MGVVLSDDLREKLERVKKREWWPVAILAELLERPKCYIYRRIENEDFTIIKNGDAYKKVLSNSVIEYYEKEIYE